MKSISKNIFELIYNNTMQMKSVRSVPDVIPQTSKNNRFRCVKASVVGPSFLITSSFVNTFIPYTRPFQTDITSDMVSVKTVFIERDSEQIDVGFIELESGPFYAPLRQELYSESQIVIVVLERTSNLVRDLRLWANEISDINKSANPKKCLVLIDVE